MFGRDLKASKGVGKLCSGKGEGLSGQSIRGQQGEAVGRLSRAGHPIKLVRVHIGLSPVGPEMGAK